MKIKQAFLSLVEPLRTYSPWLGWLEEQPTNCRRKFARPKGKLIRDPDQPHVCSVQPNTATYGMCLRLGGGAKSRREGLLPLTVKSTAKRTHPSLLCGTVSRVSTVLYGVAAAVPSSVRISRHIYILYRLPRRARRTWRTTSSVHKRAYIRRYSP